MKTKLMIASLLITCLNISAQKLHYGVLAGYSGYDIEIDGPLNSGGAVSDLNFGGFAEYQCNNRLGIRGNLVYSKIQEDDYYAIVNGTVNGKFLEEPQLKTLQLHALVKLDVRRTYNKGFYLISGFRMTHVLDAASDGDDVKDFYNSPTFGFMFGFGVNFAKHFGLELIPETNITNTIDVERNSAKNYGAYINLTVNLASILKRNQ